MRSKLAAYGRELDLVLHFNPNMKFKLQLMCLENGSKFTIKRLNSRW